ncbi:hypothetical protein BG004_002037 [Podila humilis]|nr:hypothetical protein BG004_002037 [Podila humilis]
MFPSIVSVGILCTLVVMLTYVKCYSNSSSSHVNLTSDSISQAIIGMTFVSCGYLVCKDILTSALLDSTIEIMPTKHGEMSKDKADNERGGMKGKELDAENRDYLTHYLSDTQIEGTGQVYEGWMNEMENEISLSLSKKQEVQESNEKSQERPGQFMEPSIDLAGSTSRSIQSSNYPNDFDVASPQSSLEPHDPTEKTAATAAATKPSSSMSGWLQQRTSLTKVERLTTARVGLYRTGHLRLYGTGYPRPYGTGYPRLYGTGYPRLYGTGHPRLWTSTGSMDLEPVEALVPQASTA